MLGVGRHKKRYYTEEGLKWSVEYHKGKKPIPIKLDHDHLKVASVIGAIDKLYWDDVDKVVRYEGHINDETQARNILDKTVDEVSATVLSTPEYDNNLGLVGKQPEYDELSLVKAGSFKGNSLEAVI